MRAGHCAETRGRSSGARRVLPLVLEKDSEAVVLHAQAPGVLSIGQDDDAETGVDGHGLEDRGGGGDRRGEGRDPVRRAPYPRAVVAEEAPLDERQALRGTWGSGGRTSGCRRVGGGGGSSRGC